MKAVQFEKELNDLTMTPAMWSALDRQLPAEEYRKVVNDYQRREWLNLPVCKSAFCVCRSYHGGRCTSKERCGAKSAYP